MLDTHCRKYIQPIIGYGAEFFIKCKLSANQVTVLALILGVSSGVFSYMNMPFIALGVLWISGYLDAVDGTIARRQGSTDFGTVMDITFDRIVEISIIIGLSLRHPELTAYFLFLACSIIITMTIFLTTGLMTSKKSEKSFYYQAGLAERTEGFLMFSLMIIFGTYLKIIVLVFTGMILFTAAQRFLEAKQLLSK
ncbi:MAG: CDP-alcohol phosphatidyltransferase family protein [Cetobacterium sp.]|uniref:CDP-alcohol phosphatidyltransferase family protein n=1 Tax=Cetobacterium sp. TaxID=2071632 RepID=UPI002FC7B735